MQKEDSTPMMLMYVVMASQNRETGKEVETGFMGCSW